MDEDEKVQVAAAGIWMLVIALLLAGVIAILFGCQSAALVVVNTNQ